MSEEEESSTNIVNLESIPNSPHNSFFINIANYASRLLFGEVMDTEEEKETGTDGEYLDLEVSPRAEEQTQEFVHQIQDKKNKQLKSNLSLKKVPRVPIETFSYGSNSEELAESTSAEKASSSVVLDKAQKRIIALEEKLRQLENAYIATERRVQELEREKRENGNRTNHISKKLSGDWSFLSEKLWKGVSLWHPFSPRTKVSKRRRKTVTSRLIKDMKRVRQHIPLFHWSSEESDTDISSDEGNYSTKIASSLSPCSSPSGRITIADEESDETEKRSSSVNYSSFMSQEEELVFKSAQVSGKSTDSQRNLRKGYSPTTTCSHTEKQELNTFHYPSDSLPDVVEISDCPACFDKSSRQYGNYLLWSGQFTDAATFFKERIETKCDASYQGWPNGAHPRDLLLYAESFMMRVWFTGSIQQASEASDLFDQAINAAVAGQKELEKKFLSESNSRSKEYQLALYDIEDCRLVYADGNLFKSIMLALAGHTVKAGFSLRRGWKAYATELDRTIQQLEHFETCHLYTSRWKNMSVEEFSNIPPVNKLEQQCCLEENPSREFVGFMESWMFGLGFYLLLVSLAPPGYYKVLQVLGFQGNRPLGLALLEAAFSRALGQMVSPSLPLAAPVAAHAIAWDLLEFNELSSSEFELPDDRRLSRANMVVLRCLELFPNSPIWLWLHGIYYRKLGDLTNCIAQLNQAVAGLAPVITPPTRPKRLLEYVQYIYLLIGVFHDVEEISKQLLDQRNDSVPIGSFTCLGIVELQRGNIQLADEIFFKAGCFCQRQHAHVAAAELICCSLMYLSLKKEYVDQWIDWLLKDRQSLEQQLESIQANKKDSVFGTDSSRNNGILQSWKKFSRSSVGSFVRGEERSVMTELSYCYYELGTFFRLIEEWLTAEQYLSKSVEMMGDDDTWLPMSVFFEVAQLYWDQNKVSEATTYLKQSLSASKNISSGHRSYVSKIQRLQRKIETKG
eukprot:jgi/Galph1/5071/GphlegSOOS_G3755.1